MKTKHIILILVVLVVLSVPMPFLKEYFSQEAANVGVKGQRNISILSYLSKSLTA